MDNRTPKTDCTVTQLARCADVTPDAVRYYVRIGLLKPVRNPCTEVFDGRIGIALTACRIFNI